MAQNIDQLRAKLVEASEGLKRAKGDQCAQFQTAFDKLARQYAQERAKQNLGPEPELVPADLFDAAILALTEPGSFSRKIEIEETKIERATLVKMLCAGCALDGILKSLKDTADTSELFDQHTPLKRQIRRWAEQARRDPYIDLLYQEGTGQAAVFGRAINSTYAALDTVRIKYERENAKPHKITIERRSETGALMMFCPIMWKDLSEQFEKETNEIFAHLAAAALASERIEQICAEINREVAAFFGELIPRYFKLISEMPSEKRKEITGGISLSASLAHELYSAANSTDFTMADTELKLERRRLPARLKLLVKQKGFKDARLKVAGSKMQDKSTVIFESQRVELIKESRNEAR